ncbi:hypothetical protein [Okeania sp. SIO2B3]|uniref:hypothetical protein n=1 Tax=Okeania sp. SIO2B3 TaxID=2607784 RepID=UPI0013C0535E|nr:hypothetical protein [Okeania sp. SIO2B3]NET41258.1 hypothetical protein [Okeania sp. SIO2B3]
MHLILFVTFFFQIGIIDKDIGVAEPRDESFTFHTSYTYSSHKYAMPKISAGKTLPE